MGHSNRIQVRSLDCSHCAAEWTVHAQAQIQRELTGLPWMYAPAQRRGEEGLCPVKNHL